MTPFFKSVALTCLLSLFVFSDWAMGQPWQNRNTTAQPGDIYYKGVKLGVDTPLKILEEAKIEGFDNNGNPTVAHAATFYYAQCQLLGYNGVPKDENEAQEEFRELFTCIDIGGKNRGRWAGMSMPSMGKHKRVPTSKNASFNDLMSAYIDRIRKSAEQGDTDAQIKLGIYYTLAMGVPNDPRESVNWIRQAAERGNAEAQLILADFYAEGYGGLPVSRTDFEKWVRRAAAQGDDMAQMMVEFMEEQQRPRQQQQQFQPPRNNSSNAASGNVGVRIGRVYPNTTASTLTNSAGKSMKLESGDILSSINGRAVRAMGDATRIIADLPRNSNVSIEVIDRRTSQRLTLYGRLDVSPRMRLGIDLVD